MDHIDASELLKSQYDKLANDWRAITQIIWQIPTAARAITAGIIIAAYQQYVPVFPRIIILIIGSLLLFSLAIESVKKRLTMDAIRLRLSKIEKGKIEESTFSDSVWDYIKANDPNYYGHKDFVLSLFKKSHARQALTHVIFYAGIAVSILAGREILAQIYNVKLQEVNLLWKGSLILIALSLSIEIIYFVLNKRNDKALSHYTPKEEWWSSRCALNVKTIKKVCAACLEQKTPILGCGGIWRLFLLHILGTLMLI